MTRLLVAFEAFVVAAAVAVASHYHSCTCRGGEL